MTLLLHCGSLAVSPEELRVLPTPPAMGARHVIRPFYEDINILKSQLNNVGGVIEEEAYGVRSGTYYPRQFFGVLGVKFFGVYTDSSYQIVVGVRGSYDQSIPRGVAMGSRVFVCDNLSFSGEVEVKTKQTTNIGERLPGLLAKAVEKLPNLAEFQQLKFDKYRNFQLNPVEADAMMVELVRRGAILPSSIGKILQEWDMPSHEEHSEQGRSLWRFHNAVTEGSKPAGHDRAGIPQLWGRTQVMTQFFDEIVA